MSSPWKGKGKATASEAGPSSHGGGSSMAPPLPGTTKKDMTQAIDAFVMKQISRDELDLVVDRFCHVDSSYRDYIYQEMLKHILEQHTGMDVYPNAEKRSYRESAQFIQDRDENLLQFMVNLGTDERRADIRGQDCRMTRQVVNKVFNEFYNDRGKYPWAYSPRYDLPEKLHALNNIPLHLFDAGLLSDATPARRALEPYIIYPFSYEGFLMESAERILCYTAAKWIVKAPRRCIGMVVEEDLIGQFDDAKVKLEKEMNTAISFSEMQTTNDFHGCVAIAIELLEKSNRSP